MHSYHPWEGRKPSQQMTSQVVGEQVSENVMFEKFGKIHSSLSPHERNKLVSESKRYTPELIVNYDTD